MTAAPQRPSFLRFACLLALLGNVRVVDRDARDDARDATAYVWIEHRQDGWAVVEERHYRSDPDVETRIRASGVTRPQAERCADNLAEHIRAVWADAEAVRYGGGGCVSRRAS